MFSLVLVGDWGTGKTTVSATAPKPILFLDIDNKLHKMKNLQNGIANGDLIQWAVDEPLSATPLSRLATMTGKPGQHTIVQRPKGYLQLAKYIEKLASTKCEIDHQGKKVKLATVVLDSYTTMDEHLRRLLTSVNETNTMTQPLYGALLANFEEVNNNLLRLPVNVIMICHEKVVQDDLTKKITIKPLISGQMGSKIGKDFEEVYATIKTVRQGKATYTLNTVGDNMRTCRTSLSTSGIVEPDLSKLF